MYLPSITFIPRFPKQSALSQSSINDSSITTKLNNFKTSADKPHKFVIF